MHLIKWISISILLLIILVVLAFFLSPRPSAFLVQQLFKKGVAIEPANYAQYEALVTVEKNITYRSTFKKNTLDIHSPKVAKGPSPTIIWIHGGAFVGGQKEDVSIYATMLAANGYTVINANYELAPSAQYPSPLLQLNDIVSFIYEQQENYSLDVEKIYLAGDSAGAQIVSQYALIQTDSHYAKKVAIEAKIPATSIKGLLLYCGPYDISLLSHLSDDKLVAFLLNKVGWAYIGERNWVKSNIAKLASTKDHVTAAYPPTFITDGNDMTFTTHGQDLARSLNELNVDVETLFFPKEEALLPHEYQFIFDYEQAHTAFERTLQFLQKQNEK